MPGCPCTFCHLQFPTNEALSLHLSNSPSCGEKLHAAWADFRLHVSTNPGLAPLEHNDQGNPMEIAYNVNDISNPNGGDCTYDILVDVDLPPTPPGRLPEMPTNPQRGPNGHSLSIHIQHWLPLLLERGTLSLMQFTRSRRYRETILLHLLIAMGNGT